MAGRQVIIVGMLSVDGGPARPATMVGEAGDPNLGIGGGPIYPEPPLGIWGPTDPRPTPPIYLPPGSGVVLPPGVPAHPNFLPVVPAHPIVLPDPPEKPPGAEEWQWRWTNEYHWVLDPPPSAAQPHGRRP